MTQQNRVDPWGTLNAVSARGTLMGNRGILHDEAGVIVREWASPVWVTCKLEFRGRSSPGQFRPGRYSKLFFLDEATAFAAGHRPCGECQRARYVEFRDAWKSANVPVEKWDQFTLKAVDQQLHSERVARDRSKRKSTLDLSSENLPYGTIVEWNAKAWLVSRHGALLPWTFDGYGEPVQPPQQSVSVLTPASVVRMFAAGFTPAVHTSAG